MAFQSNAGVRPHLPGEFYANWHPQLPPVTQFEHEEVAPDWTKVRQGRPVGAGGRTSAQMAGEGWVGLYLIRTLPVPQGAQVIATPEWMSEPTS